MRQAERTWATNFLRSSSPPIAEPPPVARPDGSDQRAGDELAGPELFGEALQVGFAAVDRRVRRD